MAESPEGGVGAQPRLASSQPSGSGLLVCPACGGSQHTDVFRARCRAQGSLHRIQLCQGCQSTYCVDERTWTRLAKRKKTRR